MILLRTALAFSAVVAMSGCPSWRYSTSTPVFHEVDGPPRGYGVIYVGRPAQTMGAQNILTVQVGVQQWFELYPGSYGAFYVPAGKARVRVGMAKQLNFAPSFFGATTDACDDEVEVDVVEGSATYLSARGVMGLTSASSRVERVNGADALTKLHLAAGGIPQR
ncbi:MAG: hypothetical protein QM817_04325 [Archangium sp.]